MSRKIPERWLTRIAPFPSISPMLADALEELGAAEQELDKYRRADAIMAEALRNREKECLRLAGDIRAGMKAELWAKLAQLQARNKALEVAIRKAGDLAKQGVTHGRWAQYDQIIDLAAALTRAEQEKP